MFLFFIDDVIKNNDVTKLFMIYLEFIQGKEYVCQISYKNKHFSKNYYYYYPRGAR